MSSDGSQLYAGANALSVISTLTNSVMRQSLFQEEPSTSFSLMLSADGKTIYTGYSVNTVGTAVGGVVAKIELATAGTPG